jgi:hypothetical protein
LDSFFTIIHKHRLITLLFKKTDCSRLNFIRIYMNHLDIRVQKRLYQLLYQYREQRRAKFYNYLPTIYEDKIETP